MDAAYLKLTQDERDAQTRAIANKMLNHVREVDNLILYLHDDDKPRIKRLVDDFKSALFPLRDRKPC